MLCCDGLRPWGRPACPTQRQADVAAASRRLRYHRQAAVPAARQLLRGRQLHRAVASLLQQLGLGLGLHRTWLAMHQLLLRLEERRPHPGDRLLRGQADELAQLLALLLVLLLPLRLRLARQAQLLRLLHPGPAWPVVVATLA